VSTIFIAPPEPEPLPTVLPENTIVWRRMEGESVEDALGRYHAQATACTVSVGSVGDSIPDFEEAPRITVITADLAYLATPARRDFETIHVPDDWTTEEIGAELQRAKAAGRRGVTFVVGDKAKIIESLDALRRRLDESMLPAVSLVARDLHRIMTRWYRKNTRRDRGRRSRQDGPRERNGIRLRARRGESTVSYASADVGRPDARGCPIRLVEHRKAADDA
jgi:hypothetical protein